MDAINSKTPRPDGRCQFVIYDNPSDFPGDFVVTLWDVTAGPEPARVIGYIRLEKTLEAARNHIPAGFFNLGRFPEDDPAIAEVWV